MNSVAFVIIGLRSALAAFWFHPKTKNKKKSLVFCQQILSLFSQFQPVSVSIV